MYKVKFFSGYEGKNFIGLSPEEVIRNMTDFEETFYGGKNKEVRRDISKDIIAYYDKENKICEAIQFVNEHTDVYVNGVQLMRVPEEEVIPILKRALPGEEGFTDGQNYMYMNKSLSVFVTEGQVWGVLVGKKHFLDFWKEDLEDLGHSGLMKF